MRWLLRASRRWIARGYQPRPWPNVEPRWIVDLPPDLDPSGRILAFCPSHVSAENEASQRATVSQILGQLAAAAGEAPAWLLVGLQHAPGDLAEATARIRRLAAEASAAGVPFAAFTMEDFGKVKSVNVALRVALTCGAAGLLQVDDDIDLEPECLLRLALAFRAQGGKGAVGAEKIGLSRGNRASTLLRWLKEQTRPACNYPHACCMLVDPRALAPGIPQRYVSDDGYICFTLLRPDADDPFQMLRIVPDARCRHIVGGPAIQSIRRIRRLLINHHIYMADFPPAVSTFYLQRILFPGFWPVGAREPEGTRPLRWALQAGYFTAFTAVGLELALLGLFRRPLREIRWAGFTDRARPTSARAAESAQTR